MTLRAAFKYISLILKASLGCNYGELSHMFLWDLLKSLTKTLGKDLLQAFLKDFPQYLLKLLQKYKRIVFFLIGICIFALAAPQLAPVSAQSTQATVQEILDGNQVFIQNQQAYVNDVARANQQVRTGNSRTALLFNTGAVARLSANSVLSIGQCAQLSRGTILVNGAINACSSGITTGVRGTTYLLELDESGNQQVTVLEGEVIVKRNPTSLKALNSPTSKPQATLSRVSKRPRNKPIDSKPQTNQVTDEVVLKSGEKIEVAQTGDLGVIQKLTENEFVNLLEGNLIYETFE